MPVIHLTTFIEAPIERVFDLSRNVELHKESMKHYKEEAVAGTRFGLIEKEESVTWKARHFFRTRILKIRMSEMEKPIRFIDEQSQGSFKEMKHEHFFKPCENGTIMIDFFHYEFPYGAMGKWFNSLYLTGYIKKLLRQRHDAIKEYAESSKWKRLLEK